MKNRFWGVCTGLLLALLLTHSGPLRACYLWVTDGNGEDKSTFIAYPGLQGVYVTGCTYTGPFQAANLFVIRETNQTSAQMNGATLTDVGGTPNVITSFISCGYIQDELVHSVGGGTQPGGYDIVLDYNRNGRFDANVDCILGEGSLSAFTVLAYVPVNFPTPTPGSTVIDAATIRTATQMVVARKASAGKLADRLEEMYRDYKRGVLALKALNLGMGILVNGATAGTGFALSTARSIKLAKTLGSPAGMGATQAADYAAKSAIARYRSIELDPPRQDYSLIALVDSVDLSVAVSTDDSVSVWQSRLQQLFEIEQRAGFAELVTLERLQGAAENPAQNHLNFYKQAANLRSLTDLKRQLSQARTGALTALRRHLVAGGLDGAIATDSLRMIRTRILGEGFTGLGHKAYMSSLGVPDQEQQELIRQVSAINPDELQGLSFGGLVDRYLTGEDSIRLQLGTELALIDTVLNRLVRGAGTALDAPPLGNPAGPSRVSTGRAASFTSGASLAGQELIWSELRTGATVSGQTGFSFTPSYPGYHLVAHQLTNSTSNRVIQYRLLEAVPGNRAPVIAAVTPAAGTHLVPPGTAQMVFRVQASDPEGSPLSYSWFINGVRYQQSEADTFSFSPMACQDSYFAIRVEVSDTSRGSLDASRSWDLYLPGSSALCGNRPNRRQATNWYFGNNAGLRFGNNRPVPLMDGAMGNFEGVSSISDTAGKLLFYTNGITVWNRRHQVMQNGTGLLSDPSATQGAIIVPYPGRSNLYYVFTAPSAWGIAGGFYYNIVDMSADSGRGAVTVKNVPFHYGESEKLAAVYHADQQAIWVITSDGRLNHEEIHAFLITERGFNPLPVVSRFAGTGVDLGGPGYMRVSPDGRRLAVANFTPTFTLFDFNTQTGVASAARHISHTTGGFGSYGIEFSPNGRFLYVADHRGSNTISQFDLSKGPGADSILASRVDLPPSGPAHGGLQLGPDGRIYAARESGYLGVINEPNRKGLAANYVQNGQFLGGRTSSLGLPGFIASTLITNQISVSNACLGLPTRLGLDIDSLALVDTIRWQVTAPGGGISRYTSREVVFSPTQAGSYDVVVILHWPAPSLRRDTLSTSFTISALADPVRIAYFGPNPTCADSVYLSASRFAGGYQWLRDGASVSGANGISYLATRPGRYTLQVESKTGCPARTVDTVTVVPGPAPTVATLPGGRLTTQSFAGYQWLLNGNPIPGATGQTYQPSVSGSYAVRVSNAQGCRATSEPVLFTSVAARGEGRLRLVPNPSSGRVRVELPEAAAGSATVALVDMAGKTVWQRATPLEGNALDLTLPAGYRGVYTLRVSTGTGRWLGRLCVE